MSDGFPHRPRLAEAAMLRRHRVDGQDKLVMHDTHRGEVVELSAEQLEQLLACDGTRDRGGVLLAAARRGAYRRASEIEALLVEAANRGLLADGTAPPHPVLDRPDDASPEPGERPLEPLEGYALRCDGNGSCCTTYASIPFSRAERRRALAAVPELAAELGERSRLFLPLYGAEPSALAAVTMIDGACAFLDAHGRCRVHSRAGAAQKPRGCQMFPAQLVDDGEAVRVSVAVECPCVLASLEGGAGEALTAEPLVAEGARHVSDLPLGTRIATLPETVGVSADRTAPRRELRRLTTAVLDALDDELDGVAVAWALAEAVRKSGLDSAAATRAVVAAEPPDPKALRGWLTALASRTADKCRSVTWRSERDRARRLASWLDGAAQLLVELEIQREDLAGPGRWARHEAFYLRASLHGYQLGLGNKTVAQGLRDRAIRLLLARRCGAERPAAADPSADYPITAVEAAMRGQGLDAYADGLVMD